MTESGHTQHTRPHLAALSEQASKPKFWQTQSLAAGTSKQSTEFVLTGVTKGAGRTHGVGSGAKKRYAPFSVKTGCLCASTASHKASASPARVDQSSKSKVNKAAGIGRPATAMRVISSVCVLSRLPVTNDVLPVLYCQYCRNPNLQR